MTPAKVDRPLLVPLRFITLHMLYSTIHIVLTSKLLRQVQVCTLRSPALHYVLACSLIFALIDPRYPVRFLLRAQNSSDAMHSHIYTLIRAQLYSGRRSFRSGAIRGCHCARNVIAAPSVRF